MNFQDNISRTKMYPTMQYCDITTNPKWPTAAILEIVKSPHVSKKSSDLMKVGTLQQTLNLMTVT